MGRHRELTINIRGNLLNLDVPRVMGILNVTPDSFYPGSRTSGHSEIRQRIQKMVEQGVDIIDIGGCSTRPGYTEVSEGEEWERVNLACSIVRELGIDLPLSIDTFRSSVARKAYEEWQIDIVNDVSGGTDPEMWPFVAQNHLAYVLTHNRTDGKDYKDITAEVVTELSWKLYELYKLGVNDVIVDPGLGFAKTLRQNYELLNELEELAETGCPVLVGLSRKLMIYKLIGEDSDSTLTGTVALDAIALEKGANILRVHDVREAKETVKLFCALKNIDK